MPGSLLQGIPHQPGIGGGLLGGSCSPIKTETLEVNSNPNQGFPLLAGSPPFGVPAGAAPAGAPKGDWAPRFALPAA
jgi:hypothetical protein